MFQIVAVVIGRVRGDVPQRHLYAATRSESIWMAWSRTCSLHFTPYLYLDCERKSCAPRRLLRALTAYPGQPVFCPGTLLTSLAIASHIRDYANVRSGGPCGVCACFVGTADGVSPDGRTCPGPASHHD